MQKSRRVRILELGVRVLDEVADAGARPLGGAAPEEIGGEVRPLGLGEVENVEGVEVVEVRDELVRSAGKARRRDEGSEVVTILEREVVAEARELGAGLAADARLEGRRGSSAKKNMPEVECVLGRSRELDNLR